jgi:hypothetical protein
LKRNERLMGITNGSIRCKRQHDEMERIERVTVTGEEGKERSE